MQPCFEAEYGKMFLGECSEIMSSFQDEYVDLTVTSPPYDKLRVYKGHQFCFEPIVKELFRITKWGGAVVWVVGDSTISGSESGTSFKQALYFMQCGFNLHDTMIYMKSGPSYPSQDKYYQIFEYMFVFCKGKLRTFNPLKDRENRWFGQKWSNIRSRRNVKGELKTSTWQKEQGKKFGVRFNVWKYAVGSGNHGDELAHLHPASFPEELARDHILSWSNQGDIIFDPLCGSGTTLKMAFDTGRKFIGIDVEKDYVDLSIRRLKKETDQLRLFQRVN